MDSNKEQQGKKPKGVRVKPRSIVRIRALTDKVRELFELNDPRLDVVGLYEFKLAELGIIYDWCDEKELNNQHGLTYPNEGIIKIRRDVYDGACVDKGRDRFTMCHEVGHLFLHDNVPAFARSDAPHKIYEDSEWQADTFAAEFLMPLEHVVKQCSGPLEIMKTFGVSWDAAQTRWNNLMKQGLIK